MIKIMCACTCTFLSILLINQLMHPNIIFIIYNYILINTIPDNLKKNHFEVKLILNKKR